MSAHRTGPRWSRTGALFIIVLLLPASAAGADPLRQTVPARQDTVPPSGRRQAEEVRQGAVQDSITGSGTYITHAGDLSTFTGTPEKPATVRYLDMELVAGVIIFDSRKNLLTALPLPDRSVDVVTIAFGIRNVDRPDRAVAEFARVLRPGGRLCILEFSLPRNRLMRRLYEVYFRHIMPRTATWVSGDRSGAYKYLPKSVNTFLGRDELSAMMQSAGFKQVEQYEMTLGIAVAYLGLR